MGPSGCGKSTTLRCVAGLHRIAGGAITIGDDLVAGPRVHVRPEHRRVNMVFQSYAIWPHMSVFENVAYGLKSMKLTGGEIKAVVHAMLELVGLEGLAERPATGLSGGQQQRVALARAIATRPRVLLLDEPLSNLDSVLRARMRTEMQRIQRETGTTTLYVTHDCGEALSMSDQIVVLNQGRIAQVGRPEQLYDRPASRFVARFLGFANFVRARVGMVAGGQVDVIAAGLDGAPHFQLDQSEGTALREGQSLDLVIRPERLVISQPREEAGANNKHYIAETIVKNDILASPGIPLERPAPGDADAFLSRMDGDAAALSIAPQHLTWVPQGPTDATDQP